jgi:hypothetical protein
MRSLLAAPLDWQATGVDCARLSTYRGPMGGLYLLGMAAKVGQVPGTPLSWCSALVLEGHGTAKHVHSHRLADEHLTGPRQVTG